MSSNSRQKRSQERTADSRTSSTPLVSKDVERKINEVVQYVLIMSQKKIPVKRADINKNVLKDHRTLSGEIIQKAAQKLEQLQSCSSSSFHL
uniref:non-structural maintenance of chromosomes element 3 homolog isoform X3 n=1 Tax=Myxine glutinosa TaxID=7769 RepID=UPI00358F604E